MARTGTYIGTFHKTEDGSFAEIVPNIRKAIKTLNKSTSNHSKLAALAILEGDLDLLNELVRRTEASSTKRIRLCLFGRLGENNPSAKKYREAQKFNAYQYIAISDAAHADGYIREM